MNYDKVIVSDFDGTITKHDFYLLAIEKLLQKIPTTIGPTIAPEKLRILRDCDAISLISSLQRSKS